MRSDPGLVGFGRGVGALFVVHWVMGVGAFWCESVGGIVGS